MEDQFYYDQVYKAFIDNKEEMIDAFLSKGKTNSASGFLLHTALVRKDRSFFEYLLENNAGVNWKNSHGRTLLEVAIRNEDLDIVKSLLNHGADINVSTKIVVRSLTYKDGTLLHTAVKYGNIEIVKLLLEKGMDVNGRIGDYEMKEGDSDLIVPERPLSFEEQSNCLVFDENGYFRKPQLTVLELAIVEFYTSDDIIENEKKEIIELLLENGVTLDDKTKKIHTLHLAIIINANDLFLIEKLIEYGANINYICEKQHTPLSHAVVNKYSVKSIIFYLLKRGAIFNINSINSVFHNFISKNNFCEQLFALMVDSGADINAKNKFGDTLLQFFVKVYSDFNEVQLLIDYGSNINVQDINGNTPLHLAVETGNEEVVDILLEYEADHNFSNAEGQTPLTILNDKRNVAIYEYMDLLSYEQINYDRMESVIISDRYVSYFYGDIFSSYEKITCFLVRAIVINAESGKHVNEDDLHFVKTKLLFLYNSFKNELEKTKLKRVRENISYYDILTKSVSVLETYVNKKLIENIESSEIEKEFQFYGDMLRMRITKIKERQTLVEFCQKRFKALFHLEYEPPILVKEKLLSFLNSVDLITLWRIFKGKEEYLSKFLNRPEIETTFE